MCIHSGIHLDHANSFGGLRLRQHSASIMDGNTGSSWWYNAGTKAWDYGQIPGPEGTRLDKVELFIRRDC